jgi:hypothetical protein
VGKVYGRDIDDLDDAKKTLNEYNERNGNEKRYSTGSSGSGTTLPEVTITPRSRQFVTGGPSFLIQQKLP